MTKKGFGYKDKNVVISLFMEGQSLYQKYEELLDGNTVDAQKNLNIAGNKIQQAYEIGLKYYLNKRYKELYDEHKINWSDYTHLVSVIENGRQKNNCIVDGRYLSEQMDLYSVPKRADTNIDFDLIKKNTRLIYNENKHIGNDVDIESYKKSYTEIRKFILKYIDSNPSIEMIQSPEYLNLQDACEFWSETSNYNYCLICDKVNLDDMSRRRITYIKWALVIDFDINTGNDGLLLSFFNEYGLQPNSFDIEHPNNTMFNAASKLPYWFHINGITDIPDSVPDTDRRWNQIYGAHLFECLSKYRKVFSKPLKVIILSGNAKRVESVLSALDAVYEDDFRIFLLSQEVQFEGLIENYRDVLKTFPLTEDDFSQGINNFSSLYKTDIPKDDICVCGREGKVGVQLEDYSCFDVLYLGIANREEPDKNCESFYQGSSLLSWYGVQSGFAINRIIQYRKIKNDILKACRETTSRIISLNHDPGAGGTTLARTVAFDLSKEMPVLLLNFYNEQLASIQVSNFYRKVGMSILIIAESAVISDDEIQKFNGELMAKAIPHVMVHVSRIKKGNDSSDYDLRYLSDKEFDEMVDKLDPYLSSAKKISIVEMKQKLRDRYPFFMSLYTFDNEFQGVKEYINHYMMNITPNDKTTLEYISIVDWFANKSLDVSFLNIYNEGNGIFQNPTIENLITVENIGHNSFVKMRHPRFSEEIVEYGIKSGITSSLGPANNLSKMLREFIKYSKKNLMYDLDSTIDVLKKLLILRDTDSMVKSKFAPVIEYMKTLIPIDADEHEKYNPIGLVFKELVDVYPEEPHFKAHLSRYYSHIEKNYEMGINEAKEAVTLAEQKGEFDVLLYHIYGMSIRKYVENELYSEANDYKKFGEDIAFAEKLSEINANLKLASEQFARVRDTNNKVAGYISDIEMCIAVVDFGKSIYNCSTEEFITKYKESWIMDYYDRALTLLEGFRTIQVEEDTEFYKVRLSTKCADSLQDMVYNIENTVKMWQDYLNKAENMDKPVVRRFIARAKERNYVLNSNVQEENVKQVMQLMEENINQEPENGANIRIWFNALRYYTESNDDILLDDALQKLAQWKKIGDNFEAYYYYFILVCIKAIEKSSRAEASIPDLQEELKIKTAHMPNNRVIYEWLGNGNGIHRLINSYEQNSGKYHKKPIDSIEKEACYIEGRIVKYKSERSAQIRAYGMEVFFSPSGQSTQITIEDVNKKVKFVLGFSYDGLRAMNKSVQLVDFSENEEKEKFIGKMVKCIVLGQDSTGNYLKVKLYDYRNTFGSIHNNELPEGKNVFDYKKHDIIYGKIYDESFVEKEGRTYYQIRMKEEEMTEWKRQLSECRKKIE